MGDTFVDVFLINPAKPGDPELGPVACVVDTGATLSTLPGKVIDQAGIAHSGSVSLRSADGSRVQRRVGNAYLRLDGVTIGARVIFGEPGDPALLGVTALELAGFMVDPIERKLVRKDYFQQY